MDKRAVVVVVGLVFLVSVMAGALFVRSVEANPYWWYTKVQPDAHTKPPIISIFSPENNTVYNENNVTLSFQVDCGESETALDTLLLFVVYETDWEHDNDNRFSPWNYTSFPHEVNLTKIPEGKHSITIQATEKGTYEHATAFTIDSSKTIFFTINSETEEIPEFPTWIILPLFFVATFVVVGIKWKAFHPT
jgi:hypothetical protein